MKNKNETVHNMSLKRHSIFFLFLLIISISGYSQKDILLDQTLYTPENVVAGDWIGHAKLNINEDYQSTSFSIEDNSLVSIDNNGLITAKTSAIMNTTLRVDVETDKWHDHAFITIKVSDKSKSVFIDPTASNSSQAGTKENPVTSWERLTFEANTSYFFRRGSEITAPGTLIDDKTNILFGAYDKGNKPKVNFETTVNSLKLRGCDGYVISDLILTSSTDPNRILETYSNNFTINNCIISHSGMGIRGSGDDGKILYSTFHDVNRDGIYLTGNALNLEIGNCHFYNINMRYMDNAPNTGYGEATGDAIQLEGVNCNGARIHHNIMDRHNTGHKFNLIINGFRDGVGSTNIIIEHNISIGPKVTNEQPGSGFYIVADGPISRYNEFINAPTAYANVSKGAIAHHNIIRNSKNGFGVGKNTMTINNNVFYDVDYCVGMWPDGEGGQFKNNIIYFTNANQKTGVIYDRVDISNNLFNLIPEDNTSKVVIDNGKNLPVQDPKLINPQGGNFYPQSNSPALDKGANTGYADDFDGTPIPQNGAPDIGIFEFNQNDTSHVNDPVETNRIPTANAGTNKTVNAGTIVTLDATKSSDPDNDVLSSFWTAPAEITLSSANAFKPTFTAPFPEQNTAYIFTLKVFDGNNYSNQDTVVITVNYEAMEEAQPLEIKKVEASAHDGNVPENTIDESLKTRWSAEGEGENITYELSGMDEVRYIQVSFYKGNTRKAFFEVQISNDQVNWVKLDDNMESAGVTEGFQNFDITNIDARYVRIVGHGNSENAWNSINEIKIYGVPEALKAGTTVKKELKAYPNPTAGNIKLDLRDISFNEGAIHVYNMAGALIYKKEYILPYQATEEINLEEQPNGIYIIKFSSDTNTDYVSKIILQNPNF